MLVLKLQPVIYKEMPIYTLDNQLTHSRALHTLRNPRYAGVYVFGRRRAIPQLNGNTRYKMLSQDQWQVVIPNAHEGYITWEEYQNNQQRLRDNTQAFHSDRVKTPPREGPALLQGIIICGRCGQKMTVRYHIQKGELIPDYVCQRYGIEHGQKNCQSMRGGKIDKMIGILLADMINLTSMEIVLAVQEEIEARFSDLQNIHLQQIEAARYEAELAKRRYRQVDPDNRLVASTLEAEWNEKLRLLDEAQKNYNEQQQKKALILSVEQKQQIRALATDFPSIWHSSAVAHRERKRIVRLLIEDVTLNQDTQIVAHIRFKGGTTKTLTMSLPKNAPEMFTTSADVIEKINFMLNDHTDAQIANQLNEQSFAPGRGLKFSANIIKNIRRTYGLKSLMQRLRDTGYVTVKAMASMLELSTVSIRQWCKQGRLRGRIYNDKGEYLYEPLNEDEINALKQAKGCHTGRLKCV